MNIHRASEPVPSEELALLVLDNVYRTRLDSRNYCPPINTTRNNKRNECDVLSSVRTDSGNNYYILPMKNESENLLIIQYGQSHICLRGP